MLRYFVHDGTSDSLLAAVAIALEAGDEAMVESAARAGGVLLLGEVQQVAPDPEAALALLRRVAAELGPREARRLYHASLADDPSAGAILLDYLRLARLMGREAARFEADERVRRFHRLAARVGTEIHRMKGLTRFREQADGSWYAAMAPDHRILRPVAFHFRRRMRHERWMLHDVRRREAIAWDGKRLCEWETAEFPPGAPADREAFIRSLWRQFFEHIAVPDRANPALQRRHLPVRYWRHLVELCESPPES